MVPSTVLASIFTVLVAMTATTPSAERKEDTPVRIAQPFLHIPVTVPASPSPILDRKHGADPAFDPDITGPGG